ncbi:WxL protein host-binding domain-containing protein [Paenimyroides baculatum]|nr:DUF3324 domain-containing protein [Paenimyroides baculatum]
MSVQKIFIFISVFLAYNCAFASIVISNGLTHTHKVKESMVYKGIITIQNTAEFSKSVKLYQKDYSYNANGTSHYNDFGTSERSNLQWIKLNTNLLKLEANGKANISYEITVPDHMDAGSFWSVIMVEPTDEIKPSNDKPGVQIKSVIRYSIQIITTNEKPANALLNFENINLAKQDGKRILEIDIANQGQLYHTVESSIEIFDNKSGNHKGNYKSSRLSLLPNNAKRFTIDLSTITPGKYSAVILAATHEEQVFGINIELDITDE